MRLLVVHPGASFSTADVRNGLVSALKRQGHECINYALDGRIEIASKTLFAAWKRNGKSAGVPKPSGSDVLYQASVGVIERALRFQPDWVLIVSAMYLHPDVIIMLKRAGLRVAILFTESPYDDEQQAQVARHADVVWTNERSSARQYGWGYLPHAYDPERHQPGEPMQDVPAHDVVFVGTGFRERIDLLSAVNWDGINLGLYGTWGMLGSRSKLRQYIRGGAQDNRRTVELYRAAKIGLNLYRTSKGFGWETQRIVSAESLNPRALELAACGVFTLSDYRAEVAETFGPLVPTFDNAGDLEALIRGYLENDRYRREIAAELPERVKGHTFDVRARQIVSELERASEPAYVGLANGVLAKVI